MPNQNNGPGPQQDWIDPLIEGIEAQEGGRAAEAVPLPDSSAARHSLFSLDNAVVFVTSECVAMPLNIGGGEAFVHGDYVSSAIGYGVGVPLAIVGFTYPFWKRRMRGAARNSIGRNLTWWLPIAVLLAFAYVVGPDIYRRAVAPFSPTQSPPPPSTAQALQTPADVLKLIQSLRSQVDGAKQETEGTKRQLEETRRELEIARRPPLDPDRTPTWLVLDFNGTGEPTESASTNVHWAWWNPPVPADPYGSSFGLGRSLSLSPSLDSAVTTLVFLSFDRPIKYGDIFVKGKEGLPAWEIRQKTAKTAVVWLHGKITNATLSVEILK